MRLSPAPVRSRTRGARTATGPRPVMIARSGRWPWRTSRWRPSSVCLSAWPLRKAATSASTACANSARAPSRRTSVSGSEKACWLDQLDDIILDHGVSLLRWRSGGSNTPTIRRLNPSRRHQLPRIPQEAAGGPPRLDPSRCSIVTSTARSEQPLTGTRASPLRPTICRATAQTWRSTTSSPRPSLRMATIAIGARHGAAMSASGVSSGPARKRTAGKSRCLCSLTQRRN